MPKKKRTLQKIKSQHKIEVKPTLVQKVKLFGGRIMRKARRDKKGRYSDRECLSNEKHERDYVKRVAKAWIEKLDRYESHEKVDIKAGQLRRLAEYILKK
jgi:hypothetical protein